MGKWFCDNPKVVEYIYTKGIKGIKSVYKTHKENGNLEKVTVPELKKIANVVFMDILKTNKKFIAKLKRRGKTTENPTDTGTIFKETTKAITITSLETTTAYSLESGK